MHRVAMWSRTTARLASAALRLTVDAAPRTERVSRAATPLGSMGASRRSLTSIAAAGPLATRAPLSRGVAFRTWVCTAAPTPTARAALPAAGAGARALSTSGATFVDRDLYEVLGLPKEAGDSEIKRAYRELAKEHHPDSSNPGADASKFRAASEAYRVLGSGVSRREYDSARAAKAAALQRATEGSGFNEVHHREWSQAMRDGRDTVRGMQQERGKAMRENRVRVYVPTKKQTTMRLLAPLAILALFAFNHFVWNKTRPATISASEDRRRTAAKQRRALEAYPLGRSS